MRQLGCIRAVALAIALAASSIAQAQVLDRATRDSLLGAAANAATTPQEPWRSDLLPPPVTAIGDAPLLFAGGAPSPATMNLLHVAPPPSIALAWAAQAPALAFGDERVRTMPSFSMIEAAATPAPQMLSGGLHLPRALFFFDAPLALNFSLIQPVPEPGTLGLMLAGLGVVALVARARRDRDRSPQRA